MRSPTLIILLLLINTAVFAQAKKVNSDKLFQAAETAFDEGDYRKTISLLNACLEQSPGYNDAYFMRAEAKEQLREFEAALTDYSIFLERITEHREALFNRGILRYQLKKYEQSREDFTHLLRLPPGVTNRVYFNKSASAQGVNQIMTAQSSTSSIIYNYLGLTDFRLKNFKSSIVWFDSAINLENREADYYVNRALAHQALQDTLPALRDYEKALSLNPQHSLALNNLAVFKKKSTADQELFSRAIEGDSTSLQPYLQRAQQFMAVGKYREASNDFSRALKLEDKDPEIWFSRGLAREKMNDFTGAFSDYTKAIDLKEDHFKSWINRANVLLKLKRYQDAVDDYTVALVYRPDFGAAYYNRAIARSYLGNFGEACKDLNLATDTGMKVDPNIRAKFCDR